MTLPALPQHLARERLGGDDVAVVAADSQLVVEVAHDDPDIVGLLERTAKVELADGSASVDARTLRRIDVVDSGIAVEASAPVPFKIGSPITFAIDGKIRLAASPDRVDGAAFHVPIATVDQAADLRQLLIVGAAHPMHVTHREPFTRATGFLPRAWPFLVIGAVTLLAAGLAGRNKSYGRSAAMPGSSRP